jgi:hypothetical protein
VKQYKVVVPKPGAYDPAGIDIRLYEAGEIVKAKESWQAELMDAFVANGWAIETKMDAPEETSAPVKAKVKAKKAATSKKSPADKKSSTKK